MAYFDFKHWYNDLDVVASEIIESVNDFMSEQKINVIDIEKAQITNGGKKNIVKVKFENNDTYIVTEDNVVEVFRELPISNMLEIAEYLTDIY